MLVDLRGLQAQLELVRLFARSARSQIISIAGFKLYDRDIPGIAGLTDQIHIYQTQLAAVKTSVTAPAKS